MQSQYIAVGRCDEQKVASLTPQRMRSVAYPFISSQLSATVGLGYSQDTSYPNEGQAGQCRSVVNEKKIRRDRCPRASKHCWPLASLRSLQHVPKNRLTNLWSPIQSQFPWSQRAPGNTSNSNRGRVLSASGFSGSRDQGELAC